MLTNGKPKMQVVIHLHQDKATLSDHLIGVGVTLRTMNGINITGFRVDEENRKLIIEYERG